MAITILNQIMRIYECAMCWCTTTYHKCVLYVIEAAKQRKIVTTTDDVGKSTGSCPETSTGSEDNLSDITNNSCYCSDSETEDEENDSKESYHFQLKDTNESCPLRESENGNSTESLNEVTDGCCSSGSSVESENYEKVLEKKAHDLNDKEWETLYSKIKQNIGIKSSTTDPVTLKTIKHNLM